MNYSVEGSKFEFGSCVLLAAFLTEVRAEMQDQFESRAFRSQIPVLTRMSNESYSIQIKTKYAPLWFLMSNEKLSMPACPINVPVCFIRGDPYLQDLFESRVYVWNNAVTDLIFICPFKPTEDVPLTTLK
mmetsp:Transcript_19778/g.48587  ORF Transcript_19778/g.48587 Transcript_19778/m.48587 type:complete len:130 (-) Transcript_19778:1632-2021(-)